MILLEGISSASAEAEKEQSSVAAARVGKVNRDMLFPLQLVSLGLRPSGP
jgi:hypothetical protein